MKNTDYQSALERIIAEVDEALERQFPQFPRLYIANTHAGTHRRRKRAILVAERLEAEGRGKSRIDHPIAWTSTTEEAIDVVKNGLHGSEARSAPSTIVVTLGGDGTHNHCLAAGVGEPDRFSFLRIPLGSGNDATTTASLEEFLSSLKDPLHEQWIPAVEIVSQEETRRPLFAFNIASVGIDAFITAMHDRWRGILPGNTYRLLVNLAVLRYERIVDLRACRLTILDRDGTLHDAGEAVRTLIAFGATGHRTYGDHMNVLPGEENLCVMGNAGLRDKLRMKRLFFRGEHIDDPISTMYRAQELRIEYDGRLPLQMDGETIWLEPSSFPIRMRVRERAVRTVDPVGSGS